MNAEDADNRAYLVLTNDEEQYSLWLKSHAVPTGWKATGKEGSKEDFLRYVEEVWTDMTPRSLRKS